MDLRGHWPDIDSGVTPNDTWRRSAVGCFSVNRQMMIECPMIMDYDGVPSRLIIIKLPGFVSVSSERTVRRDRIPCGGVGR